MTMLLNGKAYAATVRAGLQQQVLRLQQNNIQPGLAVILIGDNAAASVYVANKRRACDEIGIKAFDYDWPSDTPQEKLLSLIDALNKNAEIHGILVQLPLPAHIDSQAVIERIDPKKDVDGFHPFTIGKLLQRQPFLRPCTPYGVIRLLQHYEVPLQGAHAVVVGASSIVGRPMALELLLVGATVTICHSATVDLQDHVARADILIVAVGKPDVVEGHWVKPGSAVVDVGIHRLPDGRLRGDIDFEKAKKNAGWITPVPGGVGPMTVAMLMHNVVKVAEELP